MAKITLSFDTFEDRDELAMYMNAPAMSSAISNARSIIRERTKHQSPSEEEQNTLERIRQAIWINED